MKRIALLLLFCLLLMPAALAEADSSAADDFLSNLSATWDSFLDMAEEAGKDISTNVSEWVDGAVKGISAWADETGLTEWVENTASTIEGWFMKSGLSEWMRNALRQFHVLIYKLFPDYEAFPGAGAEVNLAAKILIIETGYSQAEIDWASQTMSDYLESLETASGQL